MGMDVYGLKPKSEKGTYFRNNVWYWHPLWDYCCYVLPDVTSKVQYAHSNDGDGLGAVNARKLAFALRKSVENGDAQAFINAREEHLSTLEDQPCGCTSVSIFDSYDSQGEIPFPKKDHKDPNPECYSCKGTGKSPHFAKSYHLTIENISSFSDFLFDCGGFEIC